MDLTTISYILYGCAGAASSVAVGSYLATHWVGMPGATKAFTIFAATNFACDAASKAWFTVWRITGKPPGMVDHWMVDFVTLGAGLAVLGALWFWTRKRFGNYKPLAITGSLAVLVIILTPV